jgi:hypothetical protein
MRKPQPNTLCPDLTNFKHSFPCYMKQQRSWPSKRTSNNRSTKMSTAVVVDSQFINQSEFSYQQKIHIPLSLQAYNTWLTNRPAKKTSLQIPNAWLIYSQVSTKSVKTDKSMTRTKKSQSYPVDRRHTGQGQSQAVNLQRVI